MPVAGGGGSGSPVSSGPAVESAEALVGSRVVSSPVEGAGPPVVPEVDAEPVEAASSPSSVEVVLLPGAQASVADRHDPRSERFIVPRV